jgi:hypothetical protein
MIALDVETFPIRVGDQLPRVVCVSLANEHGATILHHSELELILKDLLRNAIIVGHNIAFDMGCIALSYPSLASLIDQAYEQNRIRCTMLWAQLADFAKGANFGKYGLDAVASRMNIPYPDKDNPWRIRFGELYNIPIVDWPQPAIDYSLGDALTTFALANKLPSDLPNVAEQSRWYYWLKLSSAYGIATDAAKVKIWERDLTEKSRSMVAELISAGLVRIERGEPKRCIEAIRQRMRNTGKARFTAKGNITIDSLACEESGDSLLELYAKYAANESALSRELPILQKQFVHTRYGIAATGRSTSSDPNIQNMNKDSGSRLCFKPHDEGSVFIIADYGKLELCTLAQLCVAMGCGDNLAKALREGVDPHRIVASKILGVSYEQAKSHSNYYYARQCGKVANFGYPGGLGVDSLILYAKKLYGVTLSRAQSESLKRIWRASWPEIPIYQNKVRDHLESNNNIIDHYRSGRLRGDLSFTQGCNTLFQGLGGDVTKACGWALYRKGLLPSLFEHDAYIVECAESDYLEVANEVRKTMRETAQEWLPDVGCDSEPLAANRWIKGDAQYDEQRKLKVVLV